MVNWREYRVNTTRRLRGRKMRSVQRGDKDEGPDDENNDDDDDDYGEINHRDK